MAFADSWFRRHASRIAAHRGVRRRGAQPALPPLSYPLKAIHFQGAWSIPKVEQSSPLLSAGQNYRVLAVNQPISEIHLAPMQLHRANLA
jgi:hypothetical protein